MAMSVARRRLLLGSAGAPAAVASAALVRPGDAMAADVDCAIVGAGVAGLTAARTLMDAGRSFAVLEGRGRVGGRAWTVETVLGAPFDLGALWLHDADRNPFGAVAARLGRSTWPSPIEDALLQRDGAPVPDGGRAFRRASSALELRLGSKALWHDDFAIDAFGFPDAWQEAVARVAAFTLATDIDRLSVGDLMSLAEGADRLVEGGLGRLVADYGADVPVHLCHVVERIRWGSGAVVVEGPFGAVRARRAIVTVPPPLLAEEAIRFDPPLPPEKCEAFAALSGGRFLKVGLRLADVPQGIPEYTWDLAKAARDEATLVHVHPRYPLATVVAAGDHAAALARLSERDLVAAATAALRSAHGGRIAAQVGAAQTWDWSADPFARGAYTVRAIGADSARRDYAEPVADRLFFAGDAGGGDLAVTVAGAFDSGRGAAEAAMRAAR